MFNQQKRGVEIMIFGVFLILLATSFVSAGFFDWLKNISITGRATTSTVNLNVTVALTVAPTIITVTNNSFTTITLNEASNTNITINFTANDTYGASNLNDTTAKINITKSGETARYNQSCQKTNSVGNFANYSCQITFWWFDVNGAWTVNATIQDTSYNNASNSSTSLTINSLTGFVSGPASLSFASISPGATNTTSSNDPLELNNTGNQPIPKGGVSINATNLKGETDSTKALYTGNFTVGNSTGGSNPECDLNGNTSAVMNITSGRFAPVNGTNNQINASLMRGNYTINDHATTATAQRDLYLCLTLGGSELTTQSYSTANLGAWTIQITV